LLQKHPATKSRLNKAKEIGSKISVEKLVNNVIKKPKLKS